MRVAGYFFTVVCIQFYQGDEKKRVPIIIDDENTSEKPLKTKDDNTTAASHIDVTLTSVSGRSCDP